MSKGETAPEPSMDEILSSIRKIIAEDEVEDGTADAPPSGDAATAGAVEGDDDADDILELTEDDEVDVDVDAETDAPAVVDEPAPEPIADAETFEPDDVEAVEPAVAEPPVDEFEQVADADQAEPDGDPAEPAPDDAHAPAGEGAAVMMNEMTEVLLDSGTATAASGALQRLSAAMAPGSAVPEGDRTIEAFLADLVRPELKAWLDEHLPGLVERIVEREIKKLVRDAQPE
jgi:hypothetical protein